MTWDLNESGYCHHHLAQSGGFRCIAIAIAQNTGQRCQNAVGIDCDGFCSVHKLSNASAVRGHLPSRMFPVYMLPSRVQVLLLSSRPIDQVQLAEFIQGSETKKPQGKRSDKPLQGSGFVSWRPTRLGNSEVDHILENQCFSNVFHYISFRDVGEDVDYLASLVREDVVNELPNLCFTRAATNKTKGATVWKFLDDWLTRHMGNQGNALLIDYLLSENRDAVRLGRETTRVISGQMKFALKFFQQRLADEGETPEIDALSD